MSRPGNSIQGDGHDRRAVGVSRGWSGSIHHLIQRTLKPLVLLWPLDQRQRRHLSWQSPLRQQKAMIEKGLYEKQGLVFLSERTHRPIYDEIIGKHWSRSLERCGVKHRRLYSQRHSFLSHALAMGNSPADLAQVAGHSTEMLLKTYAKPTGRVLMPSWGKESG